MPFQNPLVAERNQSIVDEALAGGATIGGLARKYGLSPHTVKGILRKAEVRTGNKPGPRSGAEHHNNTMDRRAISQLTLQIGARLCGHRMLQEGLNLHEMGVKIGMSSQRLRAAELGMHDWTISELTRVSSLLKVPLLELLTERDLTRGAH